MSFDPKCYDLAKAFLADKPREIAIKNVDLLAQEIQTTIEEFLAKLEIEELMEDM